MRRTGELIQACQLTRPAQWPILTAQLALGMFLAAPSGADRAVWAAGLDPWRLVSAWLVWVVLLNGSTLAYNSAYDRDTGPVAYLAAPPPPPRWLAGAALAAMISGVLLGLVVVGWFFGGLVGVCVVLSVLYSHPATRWKSRPGLDLVVNMAGYGAGTTLAGLGAAGGSSPTPAGWWLAAGFGLLFGSFYPLTQIYQAEADRQRGDRTLTTTLGVRASLALALVLGTFAGGAWWLGFRAAGHLALAPAAGAALLLWLVHLAWWLRRGSRWTAAAHERGMYRALGLWAVVDAALAIVWLAG
jgi:4-hydroxybenzoate polyprenyltransferase